MIIATTVLCEKCKFHFATNINPLQVTHIVNKRFNGQEMVDIDCEDNNKVFNLPQLEEVKET